MTKMHNLVIYKYLHYIVKIYNPSLSAIKCPTNLPTLNKWEYLTLFKLITYFFAS